MSDREPGFYWVSWRERPVAQVAEWAVGQWVDGEGKSHGEGELRVWWMVGCDEPLPDEEVVVLSDRLPVPDGVGIALMTSSTRN